MATPETKLQNHRRGYPDSHQSQGGDGGMLRKVAPSRNVEKHTHVGRPARNVDEVLPNEQDEKRSCSSLCPEK